MDFINAIIIGIVEGITEFLPISSTGHILLAEHFLNSHQSDAFNICIQIGPIVAVTLVFWKDILKLITDFKNPATRNDVYKLASCFLLTGIGGLIIKKLGFELPENVLPIAIATIIGGIVIFLVEKRVKGKTLITTVTWPVVFAVAAGQLLAAIFPGTSRSGATVIAALLLGIARPQAVKFAFLVGIPTMFAAGALQIKDAIDTHQAAALLSPVSIIAFVVATITAWVTVVWLLKYVQRNTFNPFAWYRLGLGAFLLVLVAKGIMQ